MQNQVQAGDAVNVTTPAGGMVSGTGYQIGAALFGIAALTTAVNLPNVLWLVGIYNITKRNTENWALGDIIYWSPTNKIATNVNASSDLKIGVCTLAVTGTTVGQVRLTPG